jgi:hypothetical protein
MGGTGKSANTVPLPRLNNVASPHEIIERRKANQDLRGTNNLMESEGGQTLSPGGEGKAQQSGSKRINRCSIKFVLPKEKYVELTREDGHTSTHKLVK